MRKILILFLSLCFILSSCTYITESETSAAISETTAPTETENATAYAFYSETSSFVLSPSFLLFHDGKFYGDVVYYVPESEECKIFCFNPECEHIDCLATKFYGAYGGDFAYCGKSGRFYALRGKNIYSFSAAADDIKLEYSFGKEGKLTQLFYESHGHLKDMKIYDNYVYFIKTASDSDDPNDIYNLWRYDISTGEAMNLTDDCDMPVESYFVNDENIYFTRLYDYENTLYKADMDMKNITSLGTFILEDGRIVSNGNLIYHCRFDNVYNPNIYISRKKIAGLASYNLKTGESELIYKTDKYTVTLAVTEKYIYFKKYDYEDGGFTGGDDRLYRINKDGSGLIIVSNDPQFEFRDIFFYGDTVIGKNESKLFRCTINKDGLFRDFEVIEPGE